MNAQRFLGYGAQVGQVEQGGGVGIFGQLSQFAPQAIANLR